MPDPSGKYGMWGGYVPMILDTLVFDESQITSKYNYSHPTWGGVSFAYRRSRTGSSDNKDGTK